MPYNTYKMKDTKWRKPKGNPILRRTIVYYLRVDTNKNNLKVERFIAIKVNYGNISLVH